MGPPLAAPLEKFLIQRIRRAWFVSVPSWALHLAQGAEVVSLGDRERLVYHGSLTFDQACAVVDSYLRRISSP